MRGIDTAMHTAQHQPAHFARPETLLHARQFYMNALNNIPAVSGLDLRSECRLPGCSGQCFLRSCTPRRVFCPRCLELFQVPVLFGGFKSVFSLPGHSGHHYLCSMPYTTVHSTIGRAVGAEQKSYKPGGRGLYRGRTIQVSTRHVSACAGRGWLPAASLALQLRRLPCRLPRCPSAAPGPAPAG